MRRLASLLVRAIAHSALRPRTGYRTPFRRSSIHRYRRPRPRPGLVGTANPRSDVPPVEGVGETGAKIDHPLRQLLVGLLKVQDNGLSALEVLSKGLSSLIEASWFRHAHLVVRTEEVAERGLRVREPLSLLRMLKPRWKLLERQWVTYLFLRSPRSPVGVGEYCSVIEKPRNSFVWNKCVRPLHLVEAFRAWARANAQTLVTRRLNLQAPAHWLTNPECLAGRTIGTRRTRARWTKLTI